MKKSDKVNQPESLEPPQAQLPEQSQQMDKYSLARSLRGEDFLVHAGAAEEIVSLAYTGATDVEIADYLELPVSVIRNQFRRQLKRGRASLNLRLRKKQILTATHEDGDVRLLQFLGKYYLGQAENEEQTATAPLKTYQNVRIEDV